MVSEARPVEPASPRLRPLGRDPSPWDGLATSGPGRLPRPLTSLIGREGDVAAAAALLDSGARLLTLTGPGGVGKTRLALAIGEAVKAAFPDGVVFVPLATISDPELVLPTIARQLGLREVGSRPVDELLAAHLSRARLLLIVDNFEHVRAAAARISALLSACPDLAALVTSRALLHVGGERAYCVVPLALPASTVKREPSCPAPSILEDSPAVQLFIDRARMAYPGLALDERNAAALVAICRRLDGLPLAIELAAAHMRLLTPAELLARLDRTLPLLTGGPADAPDRQRTMRGTIAWSYNQLDPAARALLRRLSVFVGGFTLEAAEAVAEGGPAGDAAFPLSPVAERHSLSAAFPPPYGDLLDGLATLVDNSLLRRMSHGLGDGRFDMLDTVREFALEQLAAHGEEPAARTAHAAWCLALAERAGPELLAADHAAWLERLAVELPNLRAALTWWRDRDDAERALRLVGEIGMFWTDPHYLREGRDWLEAVVAMPGAVEAPDALALALNAIGVVAQWQGDFPRVAEALDAALVIRQELGDELGVAEVLGNLGHLALAMGDLDRANALLAESLPRYERAGRAVWAGETLMLLGHTARAGGDYDRSAAYHEAAVDVFREAPGQCKLDDGLLNLGWAHLLRGDLAPSAAAYREGLALARGRGDDMRLGRCVRGAAGLAGAVGDSRRAVRLFAAAAAQREREAIALQPVIQADHDRLLTRAREALGAATFDEAWASGARLSLTEAAAEAVAILDRLESLEPSAAGARPTASELSFSLSPREGDVLRLLVDGRTDREIAAALFISARTASSHVAAILSKLGVDSRTAAVAAALRAGLV